MEKIMIWCKRSSFYDAKWESSKPILLMTNPFFSQIDEDFDKDPFIIGIKSQLNNQNQG